MRACWLLARKKSVASVGKKASLASVAGFKFAPKEKRSAINSANTTLGITYEGRSGRDGFFRLCIIIFPLASSQTRAREAVSRTRKRSPCLTKFSSSGGLFCSTSPKRTSAADTTNTAPAANVGSSHLARRGSLLNSRLSPNAARPARPKSAKQSALPRPASCFAPGTR